MAVIPEYLATITPETSNIPRASQNIVSAGQGIVAEAIGAAAGQIGRAVIDVATVEAQKQAARDAVTLAEIKGELDNFEFNSIPAISRIQTIEDFKKQEVQYFKDWERKANTLTHGRSLTVQNQFKIYTELHRNSAKISYANKRRPMEKDWAMASIQKEWGNRLKANVGNPKATKKHLELLIDNYDAYLTRTQKQSLLADVDKSIAEFNKLRYLETVAFVTRRLPPSDAKKFINEIPRTKITEPERNSLLKQIDNQEAEKKAAFEERQEKAETGYINNLIEEKLVEGQIRADLNVGNIDTDTALRWIKLVDAQVKERLNGRVPTDEKFFIAWNELQGMVDDYGEGLRNDKEVIEDAISNAAGKTIPVSGVTGSAISLRLRLSSKDDPADPMNRSDAKRGLVVLDDLENAEITGAADEDITAIRLKYLRNKNEYEQWIKGKEKLTGKDIEDKLAEMTQKPSEDVVLNWFERLMWSKGQRQLFGLVGTEEERLVGKKVEELQKLGHWEKLTFEEQDTIRQAFRNGRKVQDVLNLIK